MMLSDRPIEVRTRTGAALHDAAQTVCRVAASTALTPIVRTKVVLPDMFEPVIDLLGARP